MKPKAFVKLARKLRKTGAVQVTSPDGFTVTWASTGDGADDGDEVEVELAPAIGFGMNVPSEVYEDDEVEEEDDGIQKSQR